MPLKSGCGIISNKFSFFNIINSIARIFPMQLMMTICTKCLKIVWFIIFSIFIYMMNNKKINIKLIANFTTYFSKLFNSLSKSICHVMNFCFTINDSRNSCTFSRTKFSFSTLKLCSTSNYFSTSLARLPLNASKRAIFFILSKSMRSKRFFTSFTNNLFITTMFIGTSSRTANLFNSLASIFERKLFVTYNTFIHKMPLKKGTLCLY